MKSREWLWSDLEKIWIDENLSKTHPHYVERLHAIFPEEKLLFTCDEPYQSSRGEMSAREFDRSKKELFVTTFKGQFFKRCPGARPGLTCCNYFVLNLGQQCNMNCSYCYLQSFLNSRVMKMFVNVQDALNELESFTSTLKNDPMRIGTGEVIDSLSLDPISMHSVELIRFFKNYPKWRLEFKTKSSQVNQFLNEPHAENVIVSFSINPQNIIEKEEHGTASIKARLEAARKCRDKGFLISFHIDPMIWHEGWEKSYSELVEQVTALFSPQDVPVMSVGALRFQPEQRHLMRDRFGMSSLVTRAETFPSSDGKLRYDRNLRETMFKHVYSAFRAHDSRWNIFMCMESPETWLKTIGHMPSAEENLRTSFDHRLIRKFDKIRTSDQSSLS